MRRTIAHACLHTRANCPRRANHRTRKTKNLPQKIFLNCLCFEFLRNTDPTVRYFLRISAKISAMLTMLLKSVTLHGNILTDGRVYR